MSAAVQPAVRDDALLARVTCPSCKQSHARYVRLAAETSFRASKRPATPELVAVCPHCNALAVVSLHPALPEGAP